MNKKLWIPLIWGFFLVSSLLLLFFIRDSFTTTPWTSQLVLEYPSYVSTGKDKSVYILDSSLKRVLALKANGELDYKLVGGSREANQFFFSDEIAADDKGYLYLLNRVMDPSGFFTVKMELQLYSPQGDLIKKLAIREYTEEERAPYLVQRGPWFGLNVHEQKVSWFEISPQGLRLWQSEGGNEAAVLRDYSIPGAHDLISYADLSPDGSIFYATRKGEVWQVLSGGESVLWYSSQFDGGGRLPWRIRINSHGKLLVSDIKRSTIFEISEPLGFQVDLLPLSVIQTVGLEVGDNFYMSLSLGSAGVVGTVSDFGAFLLSPQGNLTQVQDPTLTLLQTLKVWFWWVVFAFALAAIVFFFYSVYVHLLNRTITSFMKRVLTVMVLTSAVGSLVAFMVLDNFSKRYSSEVLNKITQLVTLVPKLIDPQVLMTVDSPEKFMNKEYRQIREDLIDTIYGKNFERNEGLYFALHRVNPQDGRLYTFMWLNGEPTVWHPYSYLWDPELAYQSSLEGETVSYAALDAFGSWLLATSPIKTRDGVVVGVFEMGGDFYSFTQENNRLIQTLILNIGTVLVLLLILMVEGSFLSSIDPRRRKEDSVTALESSSKVFLTRPLSVLLFTALSVSLLFIPLMMKELVGGEGALSSPLLSLGLPENVVLALPLSLRLFFFGLGTLVAGSLTGKLGWRPVFSVGLVFALGGVIFSATTSSPDLFLIASALLGLGTGLSTIGLRSIIASEKDPAKKSQAFSHFYAGLIAGTNLGVMAGQWLAEVIGYQQAFWVSALLIVVAGLTAWKLVPALKPASEEAGIRATKSGLLALIFNPRVLIFLLVIVLPIYVASMFLGYFLPVFTLGQGLSNGDIGRIFLLNGLVIIYMGPGLFAQIRKILKPSWGVAVTGLLWAFSLVPFLVLGDLTGVIWTVALMGLAEGLAVSFQNEYYLALPAAQKLGEDKSAGVMEVVGKIGETIAPILIGFSLVLGPIPGFALVAAIVAGGAILFALTSIRKAS